MNWISGLVLSICVVLFSCGVLGAYLKIKELIDDKFNKKDKEGFFKSRGRK